MDLFTRRGKQRIQAVAPDGDASTAMIPAGGAPPRGPMYGSSPVKPIGDLGLQARMLELEERLFDVQTHFENKYFQLNEDVTKRIDSKWEQFERYDRRFKEYIRGEQEVNQSQLVSIKAEGMDYLAQKGAHEQKIVNDIEMKVIHMDTRLSQVALMLEKLMNGEILDQNAGGSLGYDMRGVDMLPGGVLHKQIEDDENRILGSDPYATAGGAESDGTYLSPLMRAGGGVGSPSKIKDKFLSSKIIRAASRPAGGAAGGGGMLNYNVALDHLRRQMKTEQEARQNLQEEMTGNIKSLHDELRDFMAGQAHEFLKDKKTKLQEEHDNRIIKIAEGSVNSAFSKLKLELDMFHAHYQNEKLETGARSNQKEQKFLENISLATEQATKNHKELWESHIAMANEWKRAVENLQTIIDNKSAIIHQDTDRRFVTERELRDRHYQDQKKVNDAFDGRLAKAEMVVLEQNQKLQARYARLEEEEKRWEREFSAVSIVIQHLKTKLGVIGKSQQQVEELCLKKIHDESEKIAKDSSKLVETNEGLVPLYEKDGWHYCGHH